MADSESTQDKPERSRSAAAQPEPEVEKTTAPADPVMIPVGQLIAEGSALLGQPSYAVAGGLTGLDANEELDVDEAKRRVEQWLSQPVQVDPALAGEEG